MYTGHYDSFTVLPTAIPPFHPWRPSTAKIIVTICHLVCNLIISHRVISTLHFEFYDARPYVYSADGRPGKTLFFKGPSKTGKEKRVFLQPPANAHSIDWVSGVGGAVRAPHVHMTWNPPDRFLPRSRQSHNSSRLTLSSSGISIVDSPAVFDKISWFILLVSSVGIESIQ